MVTKIGVPIRKMRVDLQMILKMSFKVKYKVTKWWPPPPMTSTTFIAGIFLISRYLDKLFRRIHTFGTPGINNSCHGWRYNKNYNIRTSMNTFLSLKMPAGSSFNNCLQFWSNRSAAHDIHLQRDLWPARAALLNILQCRSRDCTENNV